MIFFIYFSVADLPFETKHFCFIKISYLQPFREIMGGQDSVKNKQTNKQQTKTTDDHNSRSPRANKITYIQIFRFNILLFFRF